MKKLLMVGTILSLSIGSAHGITSANQSALMKPVLQKFNNFQNLSKSQLQARLKDVKAQTKAAQERVAAVQKQVKQNPRMQAALEQAKQKRQELQNLQSDLLKRIKAVK